MSTRILPEGRAPWLKAGKPLADGYLYTYEPGTSTHKPTYQDAAKTTAHANPIRFDADGRPPAPIYWDGEYKYVVKDAAGVTVYTQDSYGNEPETLSAEGASLLPNGGFELDTDGDGRPDEWSITELGSNSVTLDTTSGNVKSGRQSLKFTTTDGGQAGTAASALMPWVGGERLYLRGWTKSSTASLTNSVVVYWYSDASTVLSSTTLYTDAGTAPTSYTELSGNAAAPAGARFAQLRLEGADGGGVDLGSTWFDDVRVERRAETARSADSVPASALVAASANVRYLSATEALINGVSIAAGGEEIAVSHAVEVPADRRLYLRRAHGRVSNSATRWKINAFSGTWTASDSSIDVAPDTLLVDRTGLAGGVYPINFVVRNPDATAQSSFGSGGIAVVLEIV